MKVAVLTDTYHPQKNGVVVFLEDMLTELPKYAEVFIVAPGENKSRTIVQEFKGVRTYWGPAHPFPLYEGYKISKLKRRKITEIIKKEKPDIIHLHAPVVLGMKGLVVAKKLGIPVVATHHTHLPDYIHHLSKGLLKGRVAAIAKLPAQKFIKVLYSKADVVTAPTEALKIELESYGITNAEWVPNGISFTKFGNSKKDIRKIYRIPKTAPVVLFIGRISFEKKIDVVLSAFQHVLKKNPNAYLVIGGTGPYLEDHKRIARALGLKNVIFTGFVPDELLPLLYSTADIFVSASDTETFGLTFVEAMHFGLPLVGVNKFGAADVVTKDVGFLVEPGNSKKIASKINLLLKNKKLRRTLGDAGKKEAEKYEIKKVTKTFVDLYKRLIKS